MKKVIQANDVILTAVAGGCWCACLPSTFSFTNYRTKQLGEVADENECFHQCKNSGLVYAHCEAEPPGRWESPSEFIKRLEVQKQV